MKHNQMRIETAAIAHLERIGTAATEAIDALRALGIEALSTDQQQEAYEALDAIARRARDVLVEQAREHTRSVRKRK
jgi:hypothetical protein